MTRKLYSYCHSLPFRTFEADCPDVSYIPDDLPKGSFEELGVNYNLSDSDLRATQKASAKGKRGIGKYSTGVCHILFIFF